jgi:hypothetical protein
LAEGSAEGGGWGYTDTHTSTGGAHPTPRMKPLAKKNISKKNIYGMIFTLLVGRRKNCIFHMINSGSGKQPQKTL